MRILTLEEMELVAGGCGKPKARSHKAASPKKPGRGACGGRSNSSNSSNSSSEDGGTVTPPPPPPVDTGTL
ncbi:MAG: hypothetical protein HYX42_00945 [Polaromonas sp.]|uniref:hypothetical protein n=1 Tax=Polaromonas sp. TaxID=1869339 RepID=UPI0025E11E61|nr:hypothetical protein [Polaromonas sp.]MBI2724792.1 hypothetical protein [Polaromonas sp.]